MTKLGSLGRGALVYLGLLQTCRATCYYPSGQEAVGDIPCDPNAAASPCCGGREFGIACLSNKFCLGANGRTFRGSCSVKDWSSPAALANCPQFCSLSDRNGEVISCRNVTKSDTDFCCTSGEPDCCDRGTGRIQILPSNPQTTAIWDQASSRYALVAPRSSTASSASTSSATASSATSSSTSVSSGTVSSASSTSPTSTVDTPQKTSSNNAPGSTGTGAPVDNQPSSTGLSTGAQAGIGVGVALGAVLLAAVAYLFWRLKKAQKMIESEHLAGSDAMYPPVTGEMYATPYQHVNAQSKLVEMDAHGETHELQS